MARWQGMASGPVERRKFLTQFCLLPLLACMRASTVKAESDVVNDVVIELQVQGLSKEGCVVEIAPGHPGCKFKKVRYKVDTARVLLQPIEVTSLSADRDCSFAITIKEPGMPEQTIKRGMRLVKPAAGAVKPESKITCYLATPSQVQQAKLEKAEEAPKAR
ncbi:MAG: hypothetical protein WCJ40_14935 [Planctomycetota bacterium]